LIRQRRFTRRSRLAVRVWLAGTFMIGLAAGTPAVAQDTQEAGTEPEVEADQPNGKLKPNIVVFVVDSLRADHVGAYGYDRRPTTPKIDALAKESVVFEQAYTAAPWTLPAIASLMTSTLACEHGAVHDGQQMSMELMPLAQRLRRLGYTTLALVANPYVSRAFGFERGFDVPQQVPRSGGPRVNHLLEAYPGQPFFLYIHNIEPHAPYHYAPGHTEGFDDVDPKVRTRIAELFARYLMLGRYDYAQHRAPGTTDTAAAQEFVVQALNKKHDSYVELYDAAVRASDELVGSAIEALKQNGDWDETLFVLLSDHGEEFGEHGGWLHDQSVYEELLHVPLIMHFPHEQFAGQRVHSVVSLVDVLPTIFGYMERPKSSFGARGRDLLPILRGQQPDVTEDFLIPAVRINVKKYYKPWEESRGDINVVVRKGSWKGIWNVQPDTLELYDLSHDSGEQHDLSQQNAELALAMHVAARLWYEDCVKHAAKPGPAVKSDEWLTRNLRRLGYVE